MKKNFLILSLSLASLQTFSQVGINTTEPKATLDVVGKPLETNVLDGLIVPRITASQLKSKNYTSEQKGAVIYVTENFTDSADANGQVEWVLSLIHI